jgi:hypothetical protein
VSLDSVYRIGRLMSIDRQKDLLAKIKRHAPEPVKEPPKPPAVLPKKPRIGSGAQFWLHDEDRRIIRELSAWLAGQGLRPSDSMLIRAVLRLAKPGTGLLDAYRDAAKLDGRLKQE